MLSSRRVRAFFQRVAGDWDTMRLDYYDERVIDRLLALAGLQDAPAEGVAVADVGTGTGFVAAGVAGCVGQVIAVDGSEAMLEVARGNLERLAIENVELRQGDVTALPVADDAVDAAFANMVLHHADDPTRMLSEMARVVRPGGTVAICDEVEHPYEWMREEHADVWLGFSEPQLARFFADAGLEELSIESLGMQ